MLRKNIIRGALVTFIGLNFEIQRRTKSYSDSRSNNVMILSPSKPAEQLMSKISLTPSINIVNVQQNIRTVSEKITRFLHKYIKLIYRSIYLWLCISPAILALSFCIFGNDSYNYWWTCLLKNCITLCGPCTTKFAQWIATRPDLFPLVLCQSLEGLQHQNIIGSNKQLYTILEQELGHDWKNIIDLNEENIQVLGSGCVAQVVLGQYRNKLVAIKTLHKGVKDTIMADLDILHILASLVELLPGISNMSLSETVEEFSHSMLTQLDLHVEAAALDRFRANFNHSQWFRVTFPQVYLSTSNLLIESYEEGELVSSILRKTDVSPILLKQIAKQGLDAFLKMIFEDNFIHADLHPGNIILKTTPHSTGFQLVLIDAGICVELKPEDRRNFIDLFSAVVFKDYQAVGRLMVERSRGKTVVDKEGFEASIAEIVADAHSHGLNLRRISVGKLLEKILVLCYRHEVKLESRFANLLLAIGVIEGLGRRLDPDVDLIMRATPFIVRSKAREIMHV